jgi:thiaminase/transcriptional activator TenA
MGRFTDELRAIADPIWQAQLDHPFVRGIGDGTLPLDKFCFWVRQDYVFLIEYCRVFALGAARAPDFDTLVKFAELLHETAHGEMEIHRAYAREFGIESVDLAAEAPAPTTRGYTDFLIRVAANTDFSELAAALLPCMWAFSDIGLALEARPAPADSRYARWIEMYADPAFAALADWCRRLVDGLAEEAGPATRSRMRVAFLTSVRHELAFWEMAWKGDGGQGLGVGDRGAQGSEKR